METGKLSGVEHELLGLVQAYGLAHRLLIRSERILLERLLDAPAESVTQSQISGGHFNPAVSLGLTVTGRVPVARVVA
ncbi:hypothetical protein CN212_28170 [Sinorhizobium meliloti]|nr:hypothetical protein CN235_01700 [Sinorhizobium meliloti]RVG59397.1 hypothetical protein CN220_33220 [Sinorhizobium meliloti]RVH42715.1 hypothetical protein CN212_28170 [Sinorhizobium meliloti]